uniref:Centrosomal protein 128 n=1 Tax=Salarias fasciatus TaxID=181472 RepID=A0A672IYP6_SALFA
MDTSSESDLYEGTLENRCRGREAHRRAGRDRTRGGGGGGDGRTAEISQKISTLANTLQDTSKNLTKVDRMLGQYREHTDDQAEAMVLHPEGLSVLVPASLYRLWVSATEERRFVPTSPLKDYTSPPGRRRRSRSASVRFKDSGLSVDDVHTLHQSLRDLRSDQLRLSDDLDREILRRNRYLLTRRVKTRIPSQLNRPTGRVSCIGNLQQSSFLCTSSDRSDLEREVAELRVQLCKASVLGEVEELKRALDLKEKERVQLGLQLKVKTTRRSQEGFIQTSTAMQEVFVFKSRETEALLQESARSREELKTRAQEAVRQWRAKCRRLQKALEEETAQARLHSDKRNKWILMQILQQAEAARRELAVVLGRLAQREEELHRKEVELSESLQRCLALQQESVLEEELQRQSAIQSRLRDENHRLEEEAEAQTRRCQRDRDAQAELQASLKQLKASHTQLAQRLAEEERSRKELLRDAGELKARLRELQEERDGLSKQLQLQRDGHRRELDNLRASAEEARARREREAQEALRLYAAADQELCAALRVKLDRMKDECDKLAAQLSTKEDVHTLLQRKYQLLKQELEDNVSPASGERRRASESEAARLEQKLLEAEAEQEAVLTSLGEELDAACRGLAHDGDDKLQQTKLRWLCEEVRERDAREQRLKKQHHQTRDQLKALRQSRDSEQAALLRRLDQQERLLHALSAEKKGAHYIFGSTSLPDTRFVLRFLASQNTKAALDHLESIPEKQCLMENFRDLEESQQQRDMVEQRYSKYKEMVWDLQHQLDESKRRIQEHKVRFLPLCL